MTTKLLAAALALVALLVLVGFTYRAPEPQRWEYRIFTSRVVLDDKAETADLNGEGLAGWELVAVEREGQRRTYFFRRLK